LHEKKSHVHGDSPNDVNDGVCSFPTEKHHVPYTHALSSKKGNYIFTYINRARDSAAFVKPDKLQINTKPLILTVDRCITPFDVKL
jgi:hypothetical protein